MNTYIALGSNLPWRGLRSEVIIKQAILSLNTLPQTTILSISSFYQSPPLDHSNQPDYINAVVGLNTELSAFRLLLALQKIEHMFGRKRQRVQWTARTLDLDILLYGAMHITTPLLTIPHYDLKNRDFFITPLLEINPQCILPDGSVLRYNPTRNSRLKILPTLDLGSSFLNSTTRGIL